MTDIKLPDMGVQTKERIDRRRKMIGEMGYEILKEENVWRQWEPQLAHRFYVHKPNYESITSFDVLVCGDFYTNLDPAVVQKEAARIAGSVKSPKKARASRRNGKLGGRPKKESRQ